MMEQSYECRKDEKKWEIERSTKEGREKEKEEENE